MPSEGVVTAWDCGAILSGPLGPVSLGVHTVDMHATDDPTATGVGDGVGSARGGKGGGLVVRGLHKRYGDTVALRGVDLDVGPGQLVGFLGPNGAGKTTTMRAILRLVTLDAGSIGWNGSLLEAAARRGIGYLPQERGLYARMKVHEQIAYFARLAGLDRRDAAAESDSWIARVGLEDRRDDYVQSLSVGNQQRVQLAVALVHRPYLLVMDEPFAGLDPVAVGTLQSIIVEQVEAGVAVVFSSHQLDLVQDLCEDVSIIASGRTVATGTVTELRAASPERIVDIRWADAGLRWEPPVPSARLVATEPGHTRCFVPTSTDPGAIVSAAVAHGVIESISYEPPPLDEVFLELVSDPVAP